MLLNHRILSRLLGDIVCIAVGEVIGLTFALVTDEVNSGVKSGTQLARTYLILHSK